MSEETAIRIAEALERIAVAVAAIAKEQEPMELSDLLGAMGFPSNKKQEPPA